MKSILTIQQTLWAILIGMSFNSILLASSPVSPAISIGRYLEVPNQPTEAQQHLLQQNVQVHFPKNILTIGQAIQFILQFSGYRLAPIHTMLPASQIMLSQPLPEIDRDFGPLPLQQALTTLAGEPFDLEVDPIHRLVAFQLQSHYLPLYHTAQLDKKIKKQTNKNK